MESAKSARSISTGRGPQRCRSLFVFPLPSKAERDKIYHDETYFTGPHQYTTFGAGGARVFRWRLNFFKDDKPPPGRLLDVGAACGHFMSFARDAGYEAQGIEISPFACKQAQELYGFDLTTAGIEDETNFPPERFDIVTSFDCLEHSIDLRKSFGNMARTLKPGGVLTLTLPNARGINLFLGGFDHDSVKPPEHLTLFSAKGLEYLAKDFGLDVLRIKSYWVWYALPQALEKKWLVKPFIWLGRKFFNSVLGRKLYDRIEWRLNRTHFKLRGPNTGEGLVLVARKPHTPPA